MEKIYLEEVNVERKNEAIEFINEHIEIGSNLNGTGGLDKALANDITYEEWLEDSINLKDKDYAEAKKLVPATTYFTIRESDNKIVGMVNLRHYLNDYLKKYGGHIGYGIRPSERRKGYAKIQLYLTLIKAHNMGIDKVMVDCISTNEGSERTIKALGGIFDEKVYEENRKVFLHNYWIDVNESINKYQEQYKDSIVIEKVLKK